MRLVYFDCASGISGDMMLGALVDAGVQLNELNAAIQSLGLPGCRLEAGQVRKNGFRATQVTVHCEPESTHRHLHHIIEMIERGCLSPEQKKLARQIFTRLAEAEARVHGTTIEKVHFHEVGAADSIADIVGTAVGWNLLGGDGAVASPVSVGGGRITIAHGQCSVPAPATAELLKGIPLAESSAQAELTTPTGAAILATLVDRFGPMPAMTVDRIACGAGQRDLQEQPNILRLMVGEAVDDRSHTDRACVLETNLDDISGEMIGYCTARLWAAGALDVYTTAIQMKKGRPGTILSVLCRAVDVPQIEAILFAETTTFGVRSYLVDRRVLSRQPHRVPTPWGPVEGKIAWLPAGASRFAPEYEACRRIAQDQAIPLSAVFQAAQKAFDPAAVTREETNR